MKAVNICFLLIGIGLVVESLTLRKFLIRRWWQGRFYSSLVSAFSIRRIGRRHNFVERPQALSGKL